MGLRVNVRILDAGQKQVADFVSREVLQTQSQTLNSSVLDLRLTITEQLIEVLDQVVVSDVLSKSRHEISEVLSESKTHFPGFVLASSDQSVQGMHLVLLLAQVVRHRDHLFKAHDSDHVLLILRELSVRGEQLLNQMLLVKLGGKKSELGSASSSDHGSVLIAEVDELLPQLLLLGVGSRVSWEEQSAGTHTSREPVSSGQPDYQGSEYILYLCISEGF